MPIYEYECMSCGKVTEIMGPHHMPEAFYKVCQCRYDPETKSPPHAMHRRLISACNFHLRGPGWSRDNYEDRPWGNKEYHKAVEEDGYIPGSYVKTGKARFKKKD